MADGVILVAILVPTVVSIFYDILIVLFLSFRKL